MTAERHQTLLSLASWCANVPLIRESTMIGRGDDSDFTISFPFVSTKHCLIQRNKDGTVLVKDMSKNGTFVNGERLKTGRFVEIKNGDHLSITPPGSVDINAVAFVYHDTKACLDKASVFDTRTELENIMPVKLLGRGAFGEVYLGVCNREERAVKVVRKMNNGLDLYREIKIMDKLRHPHIVGIHEVVDVKEALVMTMDLASGGDLEGLLNNGVVGESDAACLIKQILEALAYLHSEKIIHRDLKPANILLKNAVGSGMVPHLLLTDFGLAALMDSSVGLVRAKTVCGTPVYAAPEIVHAERAQREKDEIEAYDEKVDLWSTGIILYRMMAGRLPWGDTKSFGSLADQILRASTPSGRITSDATGQRMSRPCRHFLESLVVERSERLGAPEALKHEWFAQTLNKVYERSLLENLSQTQSLMEPPSETTNRQTLKRVRAPEPLDKKQRTTSLRGSKPVS